MNSEHVATAAEIQPTRRSNRRKEKLEQVKQTNTSITKETGVELVTNDDCDQQISTSNQKHLQQQQQQCSINTTEAGESESPNDNETSHANEINNSSDNVTIAISSSQSILNDCERDHIDLNENKSIQNNDDLESNTLVNAKTRGLAQEKALSTPILTRPQRQRRIPKRWEDDYEVSPNFKRLSNVSMNSQSLDNRSESETTSKTSNKKSQTKSTCSARRQKAKEVVPKLSETISITNFEIDCIDDQVISEIKEDKIETPDKRELLIEKTDDIKESDKIDTEKSNSTQIESKENEHQILKSKEDADSNELSSESIVDTIKKNEQPSLAIESSEQLSNEPLSNSDPSDSICARAQLNIEESPTTVGTNKVVNESSINQQMTSGSQEKLEIMKSKNDRKPVDSSNCKSKSDSNNNKPIKNEVTSHTSKQSIIKSNDSDSDSDQLKIDEKSSKSLNNKEQAIESNSSQNKNLSDGDKSKRSVTKQTFQQTDTSSSGEEGIDEDDAEWYSDDDPDKLWCICRKPHNNRFMIECSQCESWFHGSCVGLTQSQGSQYQKDGRKWYCPQCRTEQQNERKLISDRKASIGKTSNKETSPMKSKLISETKKRKSLDSIDEIKKRKSLDLLEKKRKSLENNHDLIEKELIKKRRPSFDSLPDKRLKKLSPDSKERVKHLHSNDEEEKRRLKKLIENKKKEHLQKQQQIKNSKNIDQRSSPNVDRPSPLTDSNQDSLKSTDQTAAISKPLNINKQDDKKRKSLQSLDPLIGDLFKPTEPIIVQKTKKSIKRSNSISSENTANISSSDCIASECRKQSLKIHDKESVYCSKECLQKHVKETIAIVKKIKHKKSNPDKPMKEEDVKIALFERKTGKFLSGSQAIAEDKILDYILKNPTYEVLLPNSRKHSTNESSVKKIKVQDRGSSVKSSSSNHLSSTSNSSSSGKDHATTTLSPGRETSANETENVRKNVKKALKKAFIGRLDSCKDLKMDHRDVKRIASEIEYELYNLFSKDSTKYKSRFRSLLFNLNDTKNEGLFKRVLTNEVKPSKLVLMNSVQLACPELANWRERENRHSIEMIKKDAEQQTHHVVVKKTHKGEEVIETKTSLPKFDEFKKAAIVKDASEESSKVSNDISTPPVSSSSLVSGKQVQQSASLTTSTSAKVVSAKDKPGCNPLDLLRDTTAEHEQHLFDLQCRICNNQAKEDLSLTNKPKPLSIFERQLLEARAEFNSERSNIDSDSSNSSSKQHQDENSADHNAYASNQVTKTIHSCWNGYIVMQDVSKFSAFAYKISGTYETRDIVDSIQVCGRIAPEQVYYYLRKIKNSSRNEITLIKFIPANDDEKPGYESFFSYLHTRNRFSVVGNSGKTIKDFYLFPLAKDQDLDESMLSFDNNNLNLEKKNKRPNYLLGILIRRSHVKEQVKNQDKSIHYSPNVNYPKVKASKASSNSPKITSNRISSSHTPPQEQKRSYTPPPPTAAILENHQKRTPVIEDNSNSMDDVSYTPPRKENEFADDEPYDPEFHTLDYPPSFKRHKSEIEKIVSIAVPDEKLNEEQLTPERSDENETMQEEQKHTPTKNLMNLLDRLSQNPDLCETKVIKVLMNEIATISSNEEQQEFFNHLKLKAEESEKQLEIKRKAAESAFNQATGSSSNNFDSNFIPGLDGDFSSVNEQKSSNESSKLLDSTSEDLKLPESLKRVLEKYSNIEDLNKANLLEVPISIYNDAEEEISKTSSNMDTSDGDQQVDEPMDLGDEDTNQQTIIEVNNLDTASSFQYNSDGANQFAMHQTNDKKIKSFSPLTEEELLIQKASIQLDRLKQMERKQDDLIVQKQSSERFQTGFQPN